MPHIQHNRLYQKLLPLFSGNNTMKFSATWITKAILRWSEENPRPMPWKETNDPYKIWVSEIILQQTRVSQGLPYYEAFIESFPTVGRLALASEAEVLRTWQGLGYNTRARNMHAAAKMIMMQHGGVFPHNYDEIRSLKGVGDYTAAAIASFAFGLPTPVMDANVVRILCRITGLSEVLSKPATREVLFDYLHKMIKGTDPALFNQALMNFGALQCMPINPKCISCRLAAKCIAFQSGRVAELPVKKKKIVRKERYFHYFLFLDKRGLVLQQRLHKDIWQHMFDLPLIESSSSRTPSPADMVNFMKMHAGSKNGYHRVYKETQVLTHQTVHGIFYIVDCRAIDPKKLPFGSQYVIFKNLKTFAFPKIIRSFISHSLRNKLPQGFKHG